MLHGIGQIHSILVLILIVQPLYFVNLLYYVH